MEKGANLKEVRKNFFLKSYLHWYSLLYNSRATKKINN